MADLGLVESYIRALPLDQRTTWFGIFREILKNLRFGHPDANGSSAQALTNFGGAFLMTTTPSVGNTEFSVAHGLGRTPYGLIQFLPLDVVGAKTVLLENTRAADDKRIYLKTATTDAPITLIVEG